MSSSRSRIIKVGELPSGQGEKVADYSFEPLSGTPFVPPGDGMDGFVPLIPCQGVPAEGSADRQDARRSPEEDVPVAEPPLPGYSEEEVVLRVDQAFQDGVREGRRQAEENLVACCSSLSDAVAALHEVREKVLRESEDDLLNLAMAVARKIIQQEIASDLSILARIVSRALDSAAGRGDVVIRLNPEDHRLLTDSPQRLLPEGDGRRMTLKPDETVPSGGCVVDTPMGEIDARIDAQLDEVYRHIMEERGVICTQAGSPEEE